MRLHSIVAEGSADFATSIATGPDLPGGVENPEIGAVDIYPLMLDILGIPATGNKGVNRLQELLSPHE